MIGSKHILLSLLIVGACAKPQPEPVLPPTKTQVKVFIPSERYFICPEVTPDVPIEEMTYQDVAILLAELKTSNDVCRDSLNRLKSILVSAKRNLEN